MAAPTKAELQARLAKLERALAREKKRKGSAEDLARARDAQAATARILRVIRRSPSDVQPVFEAIADAAMRLLKAFSVLVVRYDGSQMQLVAARGARRGSEARVRAMFPQPLRKATTIGPVGRCIISRKIIELPDARRDRNREIRKIARTRGYRSALAVPLLDGRKPIGAIAVSRTEAGAFARVDVDLLRSFADQAVIAIENARAFHDTREALVDQKASSEVLAAIAGSMSDTAPVFDQILKACERLFAGYIAGINVIRDDGLVHLAAYRGPKPEAYARLFPMKFSESATGASIAARMILHYPDLEAPGVPRGPRESGRATGVRSAIMAPLLAEEGGIGSIYVCRQIAGPFSEREIARLVGFANQATIAIKNARQFRETKEALERQTATADILKVISGSPDDVQPVFDAVAHSSMRLLGALSASVSIRVGDSLELGAFTSTSKTGDQAVKNLFPLSLTRNRDTILAKSVLKAAPAQVGDAQGVRRRPRLRQIARRRGFQSIIAVPMLSKGVAVGTVSVTRREAGGFTDHEVELLTTFADQAVIAIENVRLFNQTQEALERQTATAEILKVISGSPTDVQPVFDAVAESSMRLLGGLSAGVTLRDGDTLNLAAFTSTSPSGDNALKQSFPMSLRDNRSIPTAQVVIGGVPIHVSDTEDRSTAAQVRETARQRGYRSFIAVPMLSQGTPIGTLSVTRRDPGAFNDHDIELLTTFADQAVIAIENVRLFRELQAKNSHLSEALEQQTATAEILKVISGSPTDVQPVLEAVAERAAHLCAATDAHVWRREGDVLQVVADYGGFPVRRPRMAISRQSVMGRVVIDGKPVHVLDLPAVFGSEFPDSRPMLEAGYRTVLGIPLIREGTAIGGILIRRTAVSPFSDQQIALLQTFADQAVIAIENVRLFNETKEALERQTATAEILKVISGSPTNIQPVLDAVAENAARLCEASDAIIQLREDDRLRFAAHYGEIPNMPQDSMREISRELVTGRAVLDGRQIHVHDLPAETEEYPLGSKISAEFGYHTILATPLMREGTAIGTIMVRRTEVRPFSDKHLALVSTFADQAVIAIENVRLFNETKEALEQQTATAEVLRVISSSPSDLTPVYATLLELATRLCDAGLSALFLWDGEYLRTAAHSSTNPEFAEYLRAYRYKPGPETATRLAAQERRVVHIEDVQNDPAFSPSELHRRENMHTMLAVPLLREGALVGVLTIWRHVVQRFGEKQIALVKTFADQAVIAIENVRLFNETKEALERQTATAEVLRTISASPTDTQPVFDIIAERAVTLCGARDSAVMRYDGRLVHLAAQYNLAPEAGEALRRAFPCTLEHNSTGVRTIRTGQVVQVHDVQELPEYHLADVAAAGSARRMLGVPLMRGSQAIGAVVVAHGEPGPFSNHQIGLVKTFADQAVIAIENVRLFNETKEALERQTATGEILSVISSSPTDVQPVFDTIVKNAVALSNALFSAVYRFDGERLHLVAHHNFTPEVLEMENRVYPMRPDRGQAVGRAILDRQLVHITDALTDPDYQHDIATTGGWRSMVAIPMFREGTPLGVIWVARAQTGAFSKNQLDLLRTFADQAVIAIENVRLFNETKEALERQTATAEILRVISSSPTDVQPVFDMIGKLAGKLCAADISAVAQFDGEKMQLVALEGVAEDGVEFIRRAFPMYPGEETVIARAFQNRDVEHVADVMDNPSYARKSAARASGFRGCLGVPMIREGNVIGVIFVARVVPGYFADSQVALLKTFADQAVIAIENVRLFNDTKEALERQTATAEILEVMSRSQSDLQPVFDTIAGSAMHLCDGDQGLVYSYDGALVHIASLESMTPEGEAATRKLFPMPASRGYGTGRAILTRAPVQVADVFEDPEYEITDTARVTGWRSVLAVPMLRAGTPIGAIAVVRRQPMAFTDSEVALLKTFADQAVIAIENVRLFNETNESLERQTATAEILKVISSSPTDVQPVFDSIAKSARQLIGGRSAVVVRRVADQLHLEAVTTTTAAADDALRKSFPTPLTGQAALGKAILSGQPAYSADVETDEAFSDAYRETMRARGTRSFVAVPMLRENEAVGGIAVTRGTAGPFSDHQINLLQTFADQAVIAIENVRLFNETKEALERQTATSEILRVISGSPTDVQPVFDAIVASAVRLCDAVQSAAITREDGMLHLVAHKNWTGEGRALAESLFPMPVGRDHLTAIAVRENRVIHSVNLQQDPDAPASSRELAIAQGYDALLIVPMLREGRSRGAVVVARKGPFTEHQIALLQTFADQAVIAIDNVRLFNETKEALEQQRASGEVLAVISNSIADAQPVFEKIVESCERLFAGSKVGLNLVGADGLVHAGAYGKFPGVDKLRTEGFPHPANEESATGAAILARDVIHYPDAQGDPSVPFYARRGAEAVGFRSFIMAPLMSEGRGLGAIFVGRETVGSFTEKEIALLKTFADQAVIAIQNARLFNETKEALERQTATADILKVISESPTDVQPVFDAITRSGVHLFSECIAGILMKEGDQLALRGLAGPTQVDTEAMARTFPIPFDPETSLVARTIASCEVTQILDSEAPDAPEYVKKAGRAVGFRSLTAAPLVRDGAGIGAISIASRKAGFRLSEKQVSLLKTFADQAVIAIENVRLFKEIQQRTEALSKSVGQLTALGEVSQALSSTLDLDKVLQTIVARAVQLTGLDGGAIYEYDDALKGFYLRGAENLPEEAIAVSRSTPMRLGEGAIGRAGLAREAVQVPDILEESYQSRVREFLIRSGSRAVIAVPLLREGKLLGALAVTRNSPGEFAPEILELLKTFATQSAIAIQNARLFREIEEKGRELQLASQHKSQFLASMSHELRTPLNAILGFNEMLLGEVYGEVPADMKEPLEDIQTSGKHLLRLINNVLDLAKIEAGRMELALADYSVHDMVESVRTTLRPLAEAKGLEFLASVPNDLPLAHGDSGRLTQCLMNLAGNSLKFTKEGNVSISVEPNGESLAFRVSDTGIGIPPDKIDNLFTEFRQTDATIASEYGGTGLGLSITKKFIEMHGGRIWVESELGKGSSFIFEIPLRAEAGAAA